MALRAGYIDWNNPPPLQDEEFVVETSYDALNRPVTVTQPDNTVVSDIYDKGGLLKQVLHDGTRHITNITYNPRGQRENIYYGNNTKTRYYYHPLNFRLTRILTTRNSGQDILQDLNYSYDSVGNITSQTDNAQQTFYFNNYVIAPAGSYSYDSLYRLLTATGRELTGLSIPTDSDFVNNIPCPDTATNAMQNYTQHYRYDALGNILQMQSQNQWTRDYIYATATNRLLKHDAQQTTDDYTYDTHGNILTMPHLSNMSWDYLDQLHSATNGTFTSYYNYDAEGNRTRKVTEKGNITEIRYYIDNYELYQKYVNGSLDFERKTVNISNDEKVFVRIETKTGENPVIRYQYDNHLGSACLELDDSGQIISYEEYHPFGTTSYRSGRTETEVSLKRYKYCGKERDEETGLYYYGMRYYAAWLCRFVSVDPLQFKYPYYTPYQYAGNKPVSYIDLDGGEEDKTEQSGFSSGVGSQQNPIKIDVVYVKPTIQNLSVKINFSSSANKSVVSEYSMAILKELLINSGNESAVITSTMRTPEEQARIMLKNIEIYGKEHQNKLYAKNGRIVIAIAPDKDSLKKMNQIEKNEIIKKMAAKINELGPTTVSKHCGDPSVINVIDIAPTSLKDKKAFEQAIENSTKISKYFFPPKDPAYHIEIKQPLNQ